MLLFRMITFLCRLKKDDFMLFFSNFVSVETMWNNSK